VRFPDPLVPGYLVRRYKRFLADVTLEGHNEPTTVHCPNPGAMTGLDAPGSRVWVSPARSASRKLRWTLEIVGIGDPNAPEWVGINTSHPNTLVADAISGGTIPELGRYATLRREVKYGRNSRIDILLEDPERPPCYVEVKNVHLERPGADGCRLAAFPDSVTARGTKHLEEMSTMVADGARAVMLYCVQRADCDAFTTASDIDPVYDAALRKALDHGVEALCYQCRVEPEEIVVSSALPVSLPDAGSVAGVAETGGKARRVARSRAES